MVVDRVAFVGARGHYGYALRGLEARPAVRITALADGAPDCPVTPIAKWCDENKHSPQHFTDWRRMLDEAKPQAVVVCGPFDLHAAMSIAAIERGIHVFVEKTAAIEFDDLERLRAAHRAHPSIQLSCMMGKRYEPGIYTAWQMVRDGAIGEVRIINARKSYKLGQRPPFYGDRATYGGTIPWVASHAIDWILWLSRKRLVSVTASQSSLHNSGHGAMESTAVCQFVLSDECLATASCDMLRPERAPSHGDDWIRIVGTTGVIEARPESLSLIDASHDGTEPIRVGCDRQVFTDFLDAIAGVRAPLIDATQTLALTEACLQTRRAADEARPIDLEGDRVIGYDA